MGFFKFLGGLVPGGGLAVGAISGVAKAKPLKKFGKWVKGIFKKKEGGTVLGNTLKGAGSAAMGSVGASVGGVIADAAEKLGEGVADTGGSFGSGFKKGFLGEMFQKNRGAVIGVVVVVLVFLSWLIFGRKKRRR